MLRTRHWILAGGLLAMLGTGCETTGGSQMENTVFSIHRKVDNMENTLGQSVNRLNETSAELSMRVQTSEQQTRELRGMIEENQMMLARLDSDLRQLSGVVHQQFGLTAPRTGAAPPQQTDPVQDGFMVTEPPRVVEQSTPASPNAIDPVSPAVGPSPVQERPELFVDEGEVNLMPSPGAQEQAVADAGNPTLDYRRAQDAYRERDFARAIQLYDEFLQRYPNNPQALDALFWKATSQMNMDQHRAAINSYSRLRQQFPNDRELLPSAIFNQAIAHSKIGERSAAIELMEYVVEQFPMTQAAERARRALGQDS